MKSKIITDLQELLVLADRMIVPDERFTNREYAEADTIIQRAKKALASLAPAAK